MNPYKMANDPRWQDIASLEDTIAVIEAISECARVIRTHSLRFNPLNPVENMYRIKQEADNQDALIEKLRLFLIIERRGLEREIRSDE